MSYKFSSAFYWQKIIFQLNIFLFFSEKLFFKKAKRSFIQLSTKVDWVWMRITQYFVGFLNIKFFIKIVRSVIRIMFIIIFIYFLLIINNITIDNADIERIDRYIKKNTRIHLINILVYSWDITLFATVYNRKILNNFILIN